MPDGRIKHVHERGGTVYDGDGTPLLSVGTIQDITERKQMDNERNRLRSELAHLNRIMTINELSHSLAHEINQPLGAIMNNASAVQTLIKRPDTDSNKISKIMEYIIRDGNRAGQIIRKIRGMVKKEDGSVEQLNINTMINEVVDLLKNTFSNEHVYLQIDLQPETPVIKGDRIRLQQALTNLLTNAVEAMHTQASKTLNIRSFMQDPDTITVSISDSGIGIDDKIKDKVFQSYFTTKKDGLGVGLRLCRSIIEDHGGRVWMEDNVPEGTTFLFSLKVNHGESL